jgi:hypothetical protein
VYGDGPVSPVTKINQAAATAEITVESVRPGISVLMGSGGNITVVSAKEGKLRILPSLPHLPRRHLSLTMAPKLCHIRAGGP